MDNAAATNGSEALLVALQRGIPLVRRPFAELGGRTGLDEETVLGRLRELLDSGMARRFGGVFDSRALGYAGTLCAVDVPAAQLDAATAPLIAHAGVTHCYEREGRPNLWFTLTARADRFDGELRALAAGLAPYTLLNLPAVRRFKVQVVLGAPDGEPAAERPPACRQAAAAEAVRAFPEADRVLVRRLQGDLPVTARPFDVVADELALPVDDLLARLRAWEAEGVLRRLAAILRHRQAGFAANGMCAWRVPPADVERAGRRLAAAAEVTHCYERTCAPAFPYNLFAMIHARRQAAARELFENLSAEAGLGDGTMRLSVREFKKASPVFFGEEDDAMPGGAA